MATHLKIKNPPFVRDGPLKWPHRRVGVLNPNSMGHTKAWENFAQRARHVPGALTYSPWLKIIRNQQHP